MELFVIYSFLFHVKLTKQLLKHIVKIVMKADDLEIANEYIKFVNPVQFSEGVSLILMI